MSTKQAIAAITSTLILVGSVAFTSNSEVESIESTQKIEVPGAIEPLCSDEDGPIQTLAQLRASKIDIEIPKSRKWATNIVAAKANTGTSIDDEFKKKFKARFYVTSPEGNTCIYKGSIRISGDWRDHLSIKNGSPVASVDVQLEEGNFAGIVDFKLLLPKTRGGDNEIVLAALMREMNILAPRTAQLDVTVNGVAVSYMFQENIEKELLESQSRREAPLYESDESMFWNDRRDKKLPEGNDQRIIVPKLTNSTWVGESENRAAIAKRGIDVLYSAYSSYWETRYLYPELIANENSENLDLNFEFISLMLATNAEHGLITHNRRFYFDPMKNSLEPIYYDGDSQILDTERETLAPTFAAQQGASTLLSKLTKLDYSSFTKVLQNNGAEISLEQVTAILDNLLVRLNSFSVAKVTPLTAPTWKANNFADLNSRNRELMFATNQNDAVQCTFDLLVCNEVEIDLGKYQDLLAGKLESDGSKIIYAGGSIENYQSGLEPRQDELSPANTYSLATGESFLVTGDADVEINDLDKSIKVFARSPGSRLFIADANLDGWTISYSALPELEAPVSEDRFDDRLLTGCVNVVDSKLKNVNFYVDSALCEDGLNLVRVVGSIKQLTISKTLEDGLDLDFSKIQVDKLNVSNTGNDCLDLSAGKYLVRTTELLDCGDKGISVGETANVNLEDVSIQTAVVGLAVKDWSNLEALNVSMDNVESCILAYRKKQEFGRAVIGIQNLRCQQSPTLVQEFSELNYSK